ncbi:ADP-ribose pyrophosphatase YjhB (NUDIX family) [Clostridium acetobutylicum]|uniref:NrtR DNA-binding winged helix domain-containing protein n=1 Tax=Clostridium TaxID=1485 RepID=UPI000200A762|nr:MULTISPECIES: NUDIX domain-containing protein [Clostridium]ADZ20827.1 Nudix (MutT-like) hydrolase [Clostridium acetobutylicum EA 2018]AEI33617.1 Nudix (MutT-like) hydrolase [Clostridium acetobutylicum DSM 1731]AWV79823.1 NUDIX domain-containing protein [Clostridium acetobutylicum]MBC2394195.1 NUDIX hydrolase [Clostridium acetobutylicum]MBC2584749.1 NUDIX hydrolase [Clostridium acetobutylicum]
MRDMNKKNRNGLTEKEFLDRYVPGDYERPSNTVDMLLFTVDDVPIEGKDPNKALKILLIKRGDHPYMGCWAVPGGFVNINEGLSSACYRELKEETNVENVYFEQLKTFGDDVNRDPRMRVISVAYMALADKLSIKPKAGDDADDAKWFTVKKRFISSKGFGIDKIDTYNILLTSDDGETKIGYLVTEKFEKNGVVTIKVPSYRLLEWSKEELAFDHIEEIDCALERLKNKIEYTPIAFSLLPKYFTLREAQKVFEAILNLEKPLTRANFRRKIKKMVVETEKEKITSGRPATCYTFNEDWQHTFLDE